MGFKNKKKIDFVPMDLNEDNVETLFNRCLANEQTETKILSSLFPANNGYENPDKPITFSNQKILENKKNIRYLFGQLETVHQAIPNIYSTLGTKKYTNINWTNNTRYLYEISSFRICISV